MKHRTVKETVFRMLIHYPSLFADKADCYHHLFIVLGNGYDWINGGLIDKFDKLGDEPRWEDESGAGKPDESPFIVDFMRNDRILIAKRNNARIRFALDNIDFIIAEPVHFDNRVYPVCNLTSLFHMPKNVREDWKQACNEASSALAYWMRQEQRFPYPFEEATRLNKEFRQKHFKEQDQRMRSLFDKSQNPVDKTKPIE
jgi:hypothetical protein